MGEGNGQGRGAQNGREPIDLHAAAREAMVAAGFTPDFSDAARRQLAEIEHAPHPDHPKAEIRDLRELLWSSIDNPESRDLDQVEVAESLPGGDIRIRIGIADVDSLVPKGSPLDEHAAANTTSVYTGVETFPMLPEALSTGLTSLNEGEERRAAVVELVVTPAGDVRSHDAYLARVVNHAQLDYPGVTDWIDRERGIPPRNGGGHSGGGTHSAEKLAASDALQEQLRLQDRAAQALRGNRGRHGALDLETIETTPVMRDGKVVELAVTRLGRGRELIEDFMIAANVAMAQYLDSHGSSTIRRVVHIPERWSRIVHLARELGDELPETASSEALSAFLVRRRAADPEHFPDLSLSVIKLLGPGVYVLDRPNVPSEGHFGLAVQDYSHSTAPNRRFADLVTQRLLKAVLSGAPAPYTDEELAAIAEHCTDKEDDSRHVERLVHKKAAAALLRSHIGETYDAIVTGAGDKGTFVRTLRPPVDGMVVKGEEGMDVGDRVRVKLVHTDAERGYIDFART